MESGHDNGLPVRVEHSTVVLEDVQAGQADLGILGRQLRALGGKIPYTHHLVFAGRRERRIGFGWRLPMHCVLKSNILQYTEILASQHDRARVFDILRCEARTIQFRPVRSVVLHPADLRQDACRALRRAGMGTFRDERVVRLHRDSIGRRCALFLARLCRTPREGLQGNDKGRREFHDPNHARLAIN